MQRAPTNVKITPSDFARWLHMDVNPASPNFGAIIGQGQLPVPEYFSADWASVPYSGQYLWGVGLDQTTAEAYLYRFEQSTLNLQVVHFFGDIGLTPTGDLSFRINFGAVYASANGFLYGSENVSGRIYRFTVVPPYTWAFLASGPPTNRNDGARCIDNVEAIGTYE